MNDLQPAFRDYGDHANEVRHDAGGKFYLRATRIIAGMPHAMTVAWFRSKEDAQAAADAASIKYPNDTFTVQPAAGARFRSTHWSRL